MAAAVAGQGTPAARRRRAVGRRPLRPRREFVAGGAVATVAAGLVPDGGNGGTVDHWIQFIIGDIGFTQPGKNHRKMVI